MMAWGNECSEWDDLVDYINIEVFNYETIPDENEIITTWHENESISDVFSFAKYIAKHPVVEIENTLIIHISPYPNKKEILHKYNNA